MKKVIASYDGRSSRKSSPWEKKDENFKFDFGPKHCTTGIRKYLQIIREIREEA